MGMRDDIEEIRGRSTAIMEGPEHEQVGRFYSASTQDVLTLLGIVDTLIEDGADAETQELIASLQQQISDLTEALATLTAQYEELQTRYTRLRNYLDAAPISTAQGDAGQGRP